MRNRIWFDPPLFRWSRVLGLAVVGIALTVGWIAYERGVWQPVPVGGPGVVLAAASGAAASSPAPAASRAKVVAAVAAGSASSPTKKAPPRVLAADELEICGKGVVKVRADASEEEQDANVRAVMETPRRDAWLASMRAQSDPKARAAALVLGNKQFDDEALTEQLVRLARESRDATVYGWALYVCHGNNDVHWPACQVLSYDAWAALAPNQAIPWLYVASDESRPRRIDPAEAMYRAARADTLGSNFGVLPGLVMAAQPADAGPLDRYAMATEALGVSAAIHARTPYPTRYCAPAVLADANRRQQCETFAQLLQTKAETLLDLTVAKGLGTRLGWSAERLQSLGDEATALQAVAGGEGSPGGQPLACAAMERLVGHTMEVSRLGELGAARAAVRRSGKSLGELATSARKDMDAASQRLMPVASAPGI